jgi:hypothetical protein
MGNLAKAGSNIIILFKDYRGILLGKVYSNCALDFIEVIY